MRKLCIVGAVVVAACGPATSSMPASGPTQTTTSVTTGGGANLDIKTYNDDRPSASTVQATPERVWAVLPAVFEELKVPVGTVDPNARVIGNRKLVINNGRLAGGRASSYLSCGTNALGGPIADSYQVNLSLLTQLVPISGGATQVQTSVDGSATQRGVSSAPVRCGSTGRFEQQIAAAIQRHLQAH